MKSIVVDWVRKKLLVQCDCGTKLTCPLDKVVVECAACGNNDSLSRLRNELER